MKIAEDGFPIGSLRLTVDTIDLDDRFLQQP